MLDHKNALADFLNLTADYLKDGHVRHHGKLVPDDEPDIPIKSKRLE